MGAAGSRKPAGEQGLGSRLGAVCGGLAKRPWLLFSRLVLAAVVVGSQRWIPPPWSAAAYPVALVTALWLFNETVSGN